MKKRKSVFLLIVFLGLTACPPPKTDSETGNDGSGKNPIQSPESFDPLTGLLPVELYYGRSLLSAEEQKAYDFILKSFLTEPVTEEQKGATQITVRLKENGFALTEAQIVKIFDFLSKDDPRMALLTSSTIPRRSDNIGDTYDPSGTAIADKVFFDNTFKGMTLGNFWDTFHKPQTAEMETHILPILNTVNGNMTTAQKVRALHDAFLATVTYGSVNSRGDGNLRGAFLNPTDNPEAEIRYVVCQGYAVSFQYLLMRCGIPAITVTGTALSTPGDPDTKGSHAWNKVYVDGNWYLTDPTHDDSLVPDSPTCRYDYFLKADSSVPTHKEGLLPDGSKTGYPVFPKTAESDFPLEQTVWTEGTE